MITKGYLSVFLFIFISLVAGIFYADYVCFDFENMKWVNESELETLKFVSMSCIPTGLAYALRDIIQLYLGRRAAIISIIAASLLSVAYATYSAPTLDQTVYKEIIISGLVFLGVESIDWGIYEFVQKLKRSFWQRMVISGLVSGIADAFLWKKYLNILQFDTVILSGLTMFLPALIIALFFIHKKENIYL